jgi:hypothetical protein
MSLGGKQRGAAGDSHRHGGNAIERGWTRWPNKKMSDRMRRAAARAGQVGQTVTHFLSGA